MTELTPGVSQIVRCFGKIWLVRQRLRKRRPRFLRTLFLQVRRPHIVPGIGMSRHPFKQPAVKIDRLTRATEVLQDNAGIVDRVSVIRSKLHGLTLTAQRPTATLESQGASASLRCL